MASRRDIKAGEAYVELLLRGRKAFERGLQNAGRRLRRFGAAATRIGGLIAATGGSILASLARPLKEASDATETMNRFMAVFGKEADAASEFADKLAKSVGRSRVELLDSLSAFQSFFVGLGFGAKRAREMSQQLESLSIDFASFNNLADDEAMRRFISALSGSSEVLDRFGINIKQAALQQQLLADGVKKSWSEVTEQEKAVARLNIIMKSMTSQGAVGDAERTSHEFANRMKALRAGVKDVAIAIGNSLLPVVTPLVDRAVGIVQAIRDWVKENEGLFLTIGAIGAALTAAGVAIVSFGLSIQLVAAALEGFAILIAGAAAALSTLLSPVTLVVGAVAGLATWFVTATKFGRQMVSSLVGWFRDLASIVRETFAGIGDALAAGNLQLAAKIAMQGIEVAWLRGTHALRDAWSSFKDFFLRTTTESVFGAIRAWAKLKSEAMSIWASMETSAKSVGETIGHWLTRSSDPDIRADQDAAHRQALNRIQQEGQARQRQIEQKEQQAMAAIEKDRRAAEEDRNRAFNKEIKQREEALKASQEELAALREKAAAERKAREERDLAAAPEFEAATGGGAIAEKVKNEVFGAFTASALLAGAGAENKTVAEIRELRQQQAKQHREAQRARREGGQIT